jgi:intein/homing endonuclease
LDQDDVDQIEEEKKKESEQFKAGDLVAVVEDYDKNTFEIARILEFNEEDQATVRYYGTIRKDVEKATFKPIWIDRQGRAMFRNEARADPWTGTIATKDIIVKVKLTKGDKLDAESKKLLKDRKLMYIGME